MTIVELPNLLTGGIEVHFECKRCSSRTQAIDHLRFKRCWNCFTEIPDDELTAEYGHKPIGGAV